jgi:hypothetical protein
MGDAMKYLLLLLGLIFADVSNAASLSSFYSGVKSVQYGTINFTAGMGRQSQTATITSVNTAKAVLTNLGCLDNDMSLGTYTALYAGLTLTNATTVTGRVIMSSSDVAPACYFVVVEYY